MAMGSLLWDKPLGVQELGRPVGVIVLVPKY